MILLAFPYRGHRVLTPAAKSITDAGRCLLRKAHKRVPSSSCGCRMIQVFTLPRWGATSPGASPAADPWPIRPAERASIASPAAGW